MKQIRYIYTFIVVAVMHVVVGSALQMSAQTIRTPFPSVFRGTQNNELINGASLRPVYQKIKKGKTVKIMHIGDSHIRGNYLPRTVGQQLKSYFPHSEFNWYGINGAWARRFYEQDMINRVADEHPDLVIISFGTNEAHGAILDERMHAETMRILTTRIADRCPGVCFLFTTPPGSYVAARGSYTAQFGTQKAVNGKVPNLRNGDVAKSIVKFCNANNYAVWDIYNIAGGNSMACTNWRNAGLMATDCVHYLAQGYILQGKLLGDAIYYSYLGTATTGSQTRMMHGSTPKERKPYKSLKGL